MTDLVQKLRSDRTVTQYDSAGRLMSFEAAPTSLELAAAAELQRLHEVILVTRSIIAEGAAEGFNPLAGTWADRLFANQHDLSSALPEKLRHPRRHA